MQCSTPRLGIVHDPLFLLHDTGNHPEQPTRLRAIEERLRARGFWEKAAVIEPAPALRADILRVHTPEMFDLVTGLQSRPPDYVEEFTTFNAHTGEVALLAAGGVMTAVREVMAGTVDRAFVMVRPPGHHATRAEPMGFCFFNNVAVGVRFLDHQYGITRVAILDFDAHHGNGTQDIFYDDANVFYCSVHEENNFPPDSGAADERGTGKALGSTMNIALPPRVSREEWFRAFDAAVDAVFAFQPEFLFLAAGFDAHKLDPLAHFLLETEDFGVLTRRIVRRVKESTVRGIISVLEGGYHYRALAASAEAHLAALAELEGSSEPVGA